MEEWQLKFSQSRYRNLNLNFFIKVEKQRFKIGSLDSLMELNETLVKVDQTLDTTTKKIERLATEMSKTPIFVEVSNRGDQKTSKFHYKKRILINKIFNSCTFGLPQNFHMGTDEI